MIDFKSLRIENFLSIGEAEIDFSGGVTFVDGRNLDAPTAQSNESGKSAIFVETILWALYGKTARGLTSDDVIRDGAEECRVELAWQDGDHEYLIVRSRGRKASLEFHKDGQDLTGANMSITQDHIDRYLGVDFDLATVLLFLLDVGTVSFTSLRSEKDKKKYLETILAIPKLDDIRKLVDEKRSGIQSCCQELKEMKLMEASRLETLKEVTITPPKEIDREAMLKELEQVEGQLAGKEKVVASIREKSKDLFEQRAEAKSMCSRISSELDGVRQQWQSLEKSGKKVDQDYQREKDRIKDEKMKAMDRADRKIQQLESNICPTCGQQMDREKAAEAVAEARKELMQAVHEFDQRAGDAEARMKKEKHEVQVEQDKLKVKGEQSRTNLKDWKARLESFQEKAQEYEPKIEAGESEINGLREKMFRLKHTVEDYDSRVRQYKEEVERHRRSLELTGRIAEGLAEDLKAMEEVVEMYQFTSKEFGPEGSFRKLVLDTGLEYLNDRCRYYSTKIFGDREIRFVTRVPLKKGGYENRTGVTISGNVDYLGLSSGGRRKVDTVIALASRDAAARFSGKSFRFLGVDEYLNPLDEISSQSVMETLQEIGEDMTVFVTSHNASVPSYCQGRLQVVKQNGVSKVEVG